MFSLFTFADESDSKRRVNQTKQATTCPRICDPSGGRAGQSRVRQELSVFSGCVGCALPRLELQNNKQKQSKEAEEKEQKESRKKDSGSRETVPAIRYPLPGTLDSRIILPHEKLIKGFTVYGECQANSHVLLPASRRCSGNSRTNQPPAHHSHTPPPLLATASAQSGT